MPTYAVPDAAPPGLPHAPQSVLDLFAHGSVSFLLALVAIAIVTALIGAAIDEYVRPWAQMRLYEAWRRATIQRLEEILRRDTDSRPIAEAFFIALDNNALEIPRPLLAAWPDQLSAQAARRLDRLIASITLRPYLDSPKSPPRDRLTLMLEAFRPHLSALADDQVDLLQSKLIQAATGRAYVGALVISMTIGALLYTLARRVDPGLDLFTWFVVTGVLGFVATLLSPMLQLQVGRLLRAH